MVHFCLKSLTGFNFGTFFIKILLKTAENPLKFRLRRYFPTNLTNFHVFNSIQIAPTAPKFWSKKIDHFSPTAKKTLSLVVRFHLSRF